MAWNGSGVFSRLYSWVTDKNAGINITASRMDADADDIVTGLNNALCKDGQNVPTQNLPMGGNRHTGVGNGSARNDYAALGQFQDGTAIWGGTSTGSANAQAIAPSPVVTALVTGQRFIWIAGFTNTGAATLAVNGVAAASVVRANNTALTGYEIVAGRIHETIWDGTAHRLKVGGVVTATVVSGSAVSLSTGTPANVTSVAIPAAGEYLLIGNITFNPGGTTTIASVRGGMNTTSATLPAGSDGLGLAVIQGSLTTGASQSLSFVGRLTATAAGTVYLVAQSAFGVSTMVAYGTLEARQIT